MIEKMDHFDFRAKVLQAALDYTTGQKGITRERALFDYLVGACEAAYQIGQLESSVPPFLFIIGCRSGNRVEEIKRMLKEEGK